MSSEKGTTAKLSNTTPMPLKWILKITFFFTNRSNAYFHMKKFEKSYRDAMKSVKLKPNWAKGYYRAGVAALEIGKFEDAMKAFEENMKLDPENKTTSVFYQKAKKGFYKDKDQGEVLKLDGNKLFKAGKIEEAVKVYTEALLACSDDEKGLQVKADVYCNRAACYRNLYNDKMVIEDCTNCLKIQPRNVKALLRRAQSCEAMEKYDQAAEDYGKANMLNPGNSLAMQGASRARKLAKQQKNR